MTSSATVHGKGLTMPIRVLRMILILAGLAVHFGFGRGLKIEKYSGDRQTMTRVRVASASVVPDKWEKEKNWIRIERKVREAAGNGADIVVTPEGVLEGYVINEVNRLEEGPEKTETLERFLELGEPIDGPYIKKACDLADELEVFLVLGFLERRDNRLLNSAILTDPEGDIVGRYSKTHFAQGYEANPGFYRPGEDYPVFETPFGKVGILICYDRQHPEPARILALKGTQILLVPSYGSYTDQNGWNTIMMRTRAYENGYPVVFTHPFQSLLISQDGSLLAVGGPDEVVYYDVDLSPKRYEGRFLNRRPQTYRELTSVR